MPALSRAILWEYLGHPDDETPERRRILYAIVALRLGLGLLFLLRGWGAVFATTPAGFAARLGDPAWWGLGGATVRDQTLFILGCTELMIGVFLIAGVFTRVSAVTGAVLLALAVVAGDHLLFGPSGDPSAARASWQPYRDPVATGAALAALGGLLPLILCGSPFLSADRFLDKVEEEERDRAPAVLPGLATLAPLLVRAGLAAGLLWATAGILRATGGGWRALAPGLAALAVAAPILGGLLLAGWATRAAGVLAGGTLAGLVLLIFGPGRVGGGDALWLGLGPIAAGGALAVTGGGRLSLDRRRAARRALAMTGAGGNESAAVRESG